MYCTVQIKMNRLLFTGLPNWGRQEALQDARRLYRPSLSLHLGQIVRCQCWRLQSRSLSKGGRVPNVPRLYPRVRTSEITTGSILFENFGYIEVVPE